MVQWKGELEGDVGEKAHNLAELDDFNVPNFFVITPNEVRELFKDVKGKDQVLNSQVKGEIRNEIESAYEDVGVSSEVRNAVGKAKSLVGGQRSNSLVSIRISDRNSGEYKHELNVGSSNLFESIKKVASSYYEKNDDHPSIIVQKMVEPEYTGAIITDYSRNGLVEIVEGLGTALEEGSETPHFYLIGREGIIEKRLNEEQKKVERNPINGKKNKKTSGSFELEDQEVKEFFGEVASREMNVKFAYNRGTFHVVDVWRAERRNEEEIDSLEGIRIGSNEVEGEIGREIKFSDRPLNPEKYRALVARKGGYTSRNVQKARKYDKDAVVGYYKDLEPGTRVKIEEEGVLEVSSGHRSDDISQNSGTSDELSRGKGQYDFGQVAASKILALDPSSGDGLYTGSVFEERLKIVEGGEPQEISEESLVRSYEQVFSFDSEILVLDSRSLDHEEEIMEYLEAEEKLLILEKPDLGVVQKAIESGYRKFVVPEERVEAVRNMVAKAEKRFILEKLDE